LTDLPFWVSVRSMSPPESIVPVTFANPIVPFTFSSTVPLTLPPSSVVKAKMAAAERAYKQKNNKERISRAEKAELREAVEKTGYRGETVSLLLAHPRLAQQLVDVPPVKGATLVKVIERQAQQQRMFNEEAAWASQTSPSGKDALRVVLHLFPKLLLDGLVRDCKRNGLELTSVVPASALLQQQITQLPLAKDQVALLVAETGGAVHLQERIDRAVTVMHRDAPASSTRFVLQLQERGLPMSRVEIDRAEWVAQHTVPTPPALRLAAQQVSPGQKTAPMAMPTEDSKSQSWSGKTPGFSAEWGPSYNQTLGGPDAFFLYQLGVQSKLEHRFTDSTWLTGDFDLRVIDNYDKFKYDAPSDLPRVRTYAREYVTTSRFTMPLLQLTHVEDLGGGHYVSAYGGMLESMYGGVGAEWLYHPWQSRLSFGVDVNHVRQRDFRQNLAFRDYGINTGHATVYWDTGWRDLQVKLSAGRYLAGDVGATLDVRRVFTNGVAAGAWATKTDVSAQQFGEGSFDKGLYVTIPFDVLLPKSTVGSGNIIWNPLTRDGGARLSRRFTLDDLTRQRDYRALSWRSNAPVGVSSAEDTTYVLREPGANIFSNLGGTTATLGRQIGAIPTSTWFWAGGAILVSSLLDKPADRWAVNHQTGNADRLGTATNALPGVLALGTGLLYVSGQGASSTAETALKAAGYTYAANLVTRYAVGRARPIDEMGNASFNGFNSTATQSGFPSNHVAVTFALITPFAQDGNKPWLYGLAAASAYGRVQKRDHWVSDTVAGAFMGYAIGSLLGEQQHRKEDGMRLSVTPQAVSATWAFK